MSRSRWAAVVATVVAGVVVVAAVVTLVVVDIVLYRHQQDDDDRDAALARSRTAAVASARIRVPVLLSYSYKSLATDVPTALRTVTGALRTQFRRVLTDQVTPTAIKQQVTTSARVRDVAVVRTDPRDVDLLMFVDQRTATKAAPKPTVEPNRLLVTMSKVGDDWLISDYDVT